MSALTGAGWTISVAASLGALDVEHRRRDRPAITNVRHIALVQRAHEALTRARRRVGDAEARCRRNSCSRICRTRARRSRRLRDDGRRKNLLRAHLRAVLHREMTTTSCETANPRQFSCDLARRVTSDAFDVIVIGAGHAGCEAA